MAHYTFRVADVCEVFVWQNPMLDEREIMRELKGFPVGVSNVDNLIKLTREQIFSFEYPIFDELYRAALESKILKQNWMREICAETIGEWQLMLCNKLNEIMPYYNQLYESEKIKFNPLHNHDFWETNDQQGTIDRSDDFTADKTGKLTQVIGVTGKVDRNSVQDTTFGKTDSYSKSGKRDTNGQHENSGEENGTETRTASETTTRTQTNQGSTSGEGTENRVTDTTKKDTGNESSSLHRITSSTGHDYMSDTPQGGVENLDKLEYLTRAEKHTASGNEDSSGTTERSSNSTGKETVKGDSTSKGTSSESIEENISVERPENVTNNKTFSNQGTTSENQTWSEEGNGKEDSNTHVIGEEHQTSQQDTQRGDDTVENAVEKRVELVRSTDDYIRHFAGKTGGESYSKLLMEWRSSFLNIDRMILRELECLWFGLWG